LDAGTQRWDRYVATDEKLSSDNHKEMGGSFFLTSELCWHPAYLVA